MATKANAGRIAGLAVALGLGAAVAAASPGVASAAPLDGSGSGHANTRGASNSGKKPAAGQRISTLPRLKTATRGVPRPRTPSPDSPLSWAVLSVVRRPEVAAAVVNAAPVIRSVTLSTPTPTTGTLTGTVDAGDPNGDRITYRASASGKGKVTINTAGIFTYTPTALARHNASIANADALLTADTVNLVVTDPAGLAATTAVTVPITPKNVVPTAKISVKAPNPNAGVVYGKVAGRDADKDRLFYSVDPTTAKGGAVSVNGGGAFTYTPTPEARHVAAAGIDTTDTFTVTVDDGHGGILAVPVTVAISPKNSAPTGKATIGPRDVTTGVVTGTVVGGDADGDQITFAGSVTTAKGSVVVNADGNFTYTPTVAARAKAAVFPGPSTDKVDAFSVTLADGHGGITEVAVTITVSPSNTIGADGLTTFCGCTLMPADTIFHADLSDLPVLAQSDGWLDMLGANRGATLGANWGNMWMKSTGGMPVNVVGAAHPTETVVFNRGYSTSGPSIDSRPYAIPNRPLVEGMPSLPAWDRHLLVFQEGTCVSQELYNVANGVEMPANSLLDRIGNFLYRVRYGSKWIAEAGVHYDMSSALYPTIGWANASHLPYLPIILRPDDLARGSIDHMLGIVIAKDRGAGYTWPAGSGDGSGVSPDGVPMGSVLRLRADFDMSGYSATTQVVLRALQEHGAVIYDSTGPGQDGAKLLAMSNGWAGSEHLTAQAELNTIGMNAFEVVDVSGILVDPAIGWRIHS
ncbi:Ig-like domain-containing protein [Mycobacterium sp. CVI_P3]|uniref:Ig-like domain-containing protein n=1 Tax=Mycobacterium pinniadriaticum TaxID=2994102 RepID=A0ABT3SG34_9MYCO|nr:Ig-like domain-containing protein [Mycobacterium pinniadriaticum]MCX2932052.1 Ig-like domain-containing protein [Mycobacterium pinniadriaticum]MCX2938476.1 Ig-like domain-containing protein [Mycobacterium pinniadriaticum]